MTLEQMHRGAKEAHKGTICLLDSGAYFESLGADALIVSDVLGLMLTQYDAKPDKLVGDSVNMALCGFPGHMLQASIGKLVAAGHKVAVVEKV